MTNIELKGMVGWAIIVVVLAHFSLQLYVNSMLLKNPPADENFKRINYLNFGVNLVLLLVILYVVGKAMMK